MFNTGQTWDNGAPIGETPYPPFCVRIQRRGTVLSVFTSDDGTTFDPNGDVETVDFEDLPPTVYVGFAGTAGGVQLPIMQRKLDKVTLVQRQRQAATRPGTCRSAECSHISAGPFSPAWIRRTACLPRAL
jgi:hypothetical protein